MGGFFGAVGKRNILPDVYFGTDYHSHLGTKSAGLAAYDTDAGLQRKIHNIANAPFRTKFENILENMHGTAAIGCINDSDPQPLSVRSALGLYAICFVGRISNVEALTERYINEMCGQFGAQNCGAINGTELIAAFINQKPTFTEGIRYVQSLIEGTASILILRDNGTILAARDANGRIPVIVGKGVDDVCVSFESFAFEKLGCTEAYELAAGEIVELSQDGYKSLYKPDTPMRICSFLWTYYGYSTSDYQGINVETMRYRNGEILAQNDMDNGMFPDVDYVAGVPDTGTPHAIGYANRSKLPFARPFIKYTPTWPRSFMPTSQAERNRVAKMKQIPVKDLIYGKKLLFVDDSIVRGTQLRETVEFLYENGAKAVHMRSACPPIMFSCKFLNFSRSTSEMELITRSTIMDLEGEKGFLYLAEYSDPLTKRGRALREKICNRLHLASLEFQTLDGICKAIGLPKESLCTYCWSGQE